ncbi:toll-like receptor Tollo [Trichogramma pretiosum]|uniref:toll-like receptor Tollo n=1 Tax=Trichogramma pretiosum TaxID=7493 RepID=UPI0006C99598|nr:toll-like receptor Tollo [Trichogramma pretiosum]
MEPRRSTLIFSLLLLLLLLLGTSEARSLSSHESPRGCSWRPDEESTQSEDNEQVPQLVCRLRSMSNALGVTGNLSSGQSEALRSLGLECHEALFYESQLDVVTASTASGAFLAHLPRLERLRVDHCRIQGLPAGVFSDARVLQKLQIHSHKSEWSSSAMELNRDSLRGLEQLRELDLADNNVWTLPSEFLCPVPSLTTLNLTRNRLQEVASLGLTDWSTACARDLETLDISDNELSVLPDHGLAGLRSLLVLKLQDNVIAAVGDHALNGLVNLRSLNMSTNRLVALPPDLFAKNRELRELVLSNNSLSALAPGLFGGLDNLQSLDLSRNKLTSKWVYRDTFDKLFKLVLLDLSFNQLTKIDSHVFRGLEQLQLLNLEHNEINVLADDCFLSLGNLRSLSLSHNRIVRFEASHSVGLAVLDQFFLDENKLQHIDRRAFDNFTSLQDLRLSGNSLTEVPEAVRQLRDLKTLDMGNNRITVINADSFDGLEKLSGLRLVDNKLENISRKAFANLPALQILNLASNAIRHIEQGAFSQNALLIAIRLDGNQLTEIHGVFRNLPSLLMLNISDNKILWFNYADLPGSLEWLDMHSNQISELANDFSGNREDLRIKKLDASYNRIEEINDAAIPNSVEKLYLNNNKIRTVAPGTFMHKTNLMKVTLNNNDVQHLEIGAIELAPVSSDRELPQFYIGENPILCDCTMEWLPRINELSRMRQHPRVMDLESVTCDMVHARAAPKRPLLSLKSKDFVCRYSSHCFALCHCCDFDACDCEMTCPDNCSCYHDHSWSSNVVDCSNAGYRTVPERIPMDATELYLDGNELGDLGSHLLIGKRKLETLYLNNSGINSINNRTFTGAENLKVLHMESNALREIRAHDLVNLEQLTELYLDHNAIAVIEDETFAKMRGLQVLRVNHNRMVDFRPWEALVSLGTQVGLEANFWSCDCDSVNRLRVWLAEHRSESAERMYCRDEVESVAQAIQRCNAGQAPVNVNTYASNHGLQAGSSMGNTVVRHNPAVIGGSFVPMLAGVLVAIIAVCLLVAVGFAFRQDVRLWAHSRYGLRLGKLSTQCPEEERDRLYDGYFLYSERDEEFVTRYLAPELEQSGLALCLHYRDLPPTRPQESLIPAAAASRRIVMAFSPHFLANEWQNPEFRAALRIALDNIRPAVRRRCVIILLATDAPCRDPELQLLLQTCTVIVWGEKRFWDKLRYAMPDSAEHVGKGTHQRKAPASCHQAGQGGIPARYAAAPSVVVDAWASKPVQMHQQHQQQAAMQTPLVATSSTCTSSSGTGVLVQPLHAPTPTPTQSTYVSSASSRTEDEDSGHEQQQQQHHHHLHHAHHHHHHHHHLQAQQLQPQLEQQHQIGYSALHPAGTQPRPSSVNSRHSSHLYSTIPELPYGTTGQQLPVNPRTYFV